MRQEQNVFDDVGNTAMSASEPYLELGFQGQLSMIHIDNRLDSHLWQSNSVMGRMSIWHSFQMACVLNDFATQKCTDRNRASESEAERRNWVCDQNDIGDSA